MIHLDFCKWLDMADLTVKLWITNKIDTVESGFSQLSPIIPKLYITDFKVLTLRDQRISYNDILFLSNVEKLEFCNVILKNEDGTIVKLEKLVKVLPKTKYITISETLKEYSNSMISKNTVNELLKLPHFSKITNFNLDDIPETFDIETCFAFIKENKISKFRLHFSSSISAAHKTRLEAIIDEILQTENHDYKVPFIDFRACNRNFSITKNGENTVHFSIKIKSL
uniref:FTH domain-containing protein n=1 Tax=Panagrolaimus sp. PS1159 TaxID=55785 RepID=A0AC35F0A6_9BILA